MFDVVTPDQNELSLTVEIEGVNDAEARLPCPAAARHMEPAAKGQAEDEQDKERRD